MASGADRFYGPLALAPRSWIAGSPLGQVALAAVRCSGAALQHCSAALRQDREVVEAAVSQAPAALEFAHEDLRGSRIASASVFIHRL